MDFDFESTGKQYDSVEDLVRAEIQGDAKHMTLELIARDEGKNNLDTDQRVDLILLQSLLRTDSGAPVS